MSYVCKFCGKEYDAVYDNLSLLCCNKAAFAPGHSALKKVKK